MWNITQYATREFNNIIDLFYLLLYWTDREKKEDIAFFSVCKKEFVLVSVCENEFFSFSVCKKEFVIFSACEKWTCFILCLWKKVYFLHKHSDFKELDCVLFYFSDSIKSDSYFSPLVYSYFSLSEQIIYWMFSPSV